MDKRLSSFLGTMLSALLGLLLWVLVLMISNAHNKPLDITKNGRFTLAEQSRSVTSGLTQQVKVLTFARENDRTKAEELLGRYKRENPDKFSFQVLDPLKNPTLARENQIRMAGEGVLQLLKPDGKIERTEHLGALTEQDVTAAMLKLQRRKSFKAYSLTGHGERDLQGQGQEDPVSLTQLKADLAKEGFSLEALSLTATPQIPADADALLLAGPTRPLLPGEEKIVKEYLARHGRLLLCLEPETPQSYVDLMKSYGVDTSQEVALDFNATRLGGEPSFAYGSGFDKSHPITKDFRIMTQFQLARPLKAVTPAPAGCTVAGIVTTDTQHPQAVLIPLDKVKGGRITENDLKGLTPTVVNLVMAVTKADAAAATPTPSATPAADSVKDTPETRVVVVGDADFLGNYLYPSNKDLALNSFNWLADNNVQLSIRPKDPNATPFSMTGGEQGRMLLGLAILLPGLLVLIGVFTVVRRQ